MPRASNEMLPNPSFHRTCAKSRAGRWIQTLNGSFSQGATPATDWDRPLGRIRQGSVQADHLSPSGIGIAPTLARRFGRSRVRRRWRLRIGTTGGFEVDTAADLIKLRTVGKTPCASESPATTSQLRRRTPRPRNHRRLHGRRAGALRDR